MNKHSSLAINHPIEGPIVDHTQIERFLGKDPDIIKETFDILLKNLYEEQQELHKASQNQDWNTIQAIAHKLRGGACYCGLLRLEQACMQLERYLQMNPKEEAETFYSQLLTEIEAAQHYLQDSFVF